MEHSIMEIWDFGKLCGPHFLNSRKQIGFENAHPDASNSRRKMGFGKSSNSQNPNLHFQPSMELFDISGKMDLEKLITTNQVWDFFTETFDLL